MAEDPTKPPAGISAASLIAEGGNAGPSEADMLAGGDIEEEATAQEATADDAESGTADDAGGDQGSDEGGDAGAVTEEDDEPDDGEGGNPKPEDEVADLNAIKIEGEDEEEPATAADPAAIKIEDDAEFKDVPPSVEDYVSKASPIDLTVYDTALKSIQADADAGELPEGTAKALAAVVAQGKAIAEAEHTRRQMVKRDLSRSAKMLKVQEEQRSTHLDRFIDTLGLDANLIGKAGARGESQKAIVGKLITKAKVLFEEAKKSGKKLPDDKAFLLEAARRLKIQPNGKPATPAPQGKPASQWGKVVPQGKPAKPAPQANTPARRKRVTGIDLEAQLLSGG